MGKHSPETTNLRVWWRRHALLSVEAKLSTSLEYQEWFGIDLNLGTRVLCEGLLPWMRFPF